MKFEYPKAYSIYGASMGRREIHVGDPVGKMHLQRVRLDRGGYDSGGAYWGTGMPLYRYEDEDAGNVQGYLRARNREDAKAQIRVKYPEVRFYR